MHPLNPDAGAVPITTDPGELAIAVRAGDVIWRLFPYIRRRYGKRGRRFGHSDVAWLFTLLDREPRERLEQMFWLSDVLSWRGMPSVLLERQLDLLARISAKRLGAPRYRIFVEMAEELRARRRLVFSDTSFDDLSTGFVLRVGDGPSPFTLSYGALLTSAVADAQLGAEGAVDAITAWLLDPAHSAPNWRRAVSESVDEARSKARKVSRRHQEKLRGAL